MESFVLFRFVQILRLPILLEFLQLCQEGAGRVVIGESTDMLPQVILRILKAAAKE